MHKIKLLYKLTFILLCGFMFAGAAKGPEYRSLRVHGMGGAFIAIADNKDALYYNPAGLNLINRMGNFEKNPDMGYLPQKSFELRLLTVSASLPANEITNVIKICGAPTVGKMVNRIIFFDFGYFGDIKDWCPDIKDIFPDDMSEISDSLNAHKELADKLSTLHRRPIEIGTQVSILEFAMHNFGFSVWANTSAAPYIDIGVGIPGFGYAPVQADIVAQTAMAFSPVDNWSVGVGFKTAKRYREPYFELWPGLSSSLNDVEYQDQLDTLQERWDNFKDDSLSFKNITKNINFALDFGVLYQITREIRLGASLRNVFFSKLAGESITPNLSIGAMASPMILQSNSLWGRKLNFAADYVDILDGTVSDMFLAHLNIGAEIEQVIVPFLLKVSLGGGFESGYYAWNTGFGIGDVVAMRFGSYAEERGTRTGQKEHRFWTGEVSVGF
ncbi:MAG: hypothetical protein LBQ76_08225 [Candidatus Fibromonas sp.]|nr:hypothetical protein [Candidatus Fibromonas sp.]